MSVEPGFSSSSPVKTTYLAGPMTGYEHYNFPAFDRNAAFIRDQGWNVISPAELDRNSGFEGIGKTGNEATLSEFDQAMRRDYAALLSCDAIAFMPGWENSRGAKLESDFANVLKLDRYRVDVSRNYFEKELVIGLTGYARSGKDTVAQELVQNSSFERHAFADALRTILYALNPHIVLDDSDYAGNWPVQSIVDKRGWDAAKKESEIRQLLQRLGTEGGRQALGTDVWVKTLFSQPYGARLVIPDVRFENEAEAIHQRGGIVVRINREGVGPINSHSSDQINFKADFEIHNDGSPKEAYLQIIDSLPEFGIEL